MNIEWKPTNEYYRAIVNAADLAQKRELYRTNILAPWRPMMDMMKGMFGADPDDEFGVAQAWAWHLPEELNEIPDSLTKLESANAWQIGKTALQKGIESFADYDLPFDTIEGWLMVGVPARNRAEGDGYTGAIDFMNPRFVVQYFEPHARNLQALPGAVVHEFNHLIRLRLFPWNMATTSVGDYIIHEGLAESFATALFGEEVLGFYAADIADADLEIARQLIGENLETIGFDKIRGFIFGDSMAEEWGFTKVGMPNFGGYAVGYRVVQAFLQKTGRTIQEATYTPADQIIAESGYFS